MMNKQMPTTGTNWNDLQEEMLRRGSHDAKWREGKTAVYVFNAGPDVTQVQKEAYTMYMSENGLGPLAFPSLKQMEDEVVGMGLWLLHGNDDSTGSITSGGTDSITMAVKAARDFAIANKNVTGTPNIVAPWSAHPAFDKAAKLMSLEIRRLPLQEDFLADAAAMSDAIDSNTIMMVGSAPSFPYGLIDPIEELGEVAVNKDIWLHVDACVGGYIAPFVRMNGADIPAFDFEVPGVMSMSADLHKYGYCAKGASTVLFRNEELHQYMVFDCDNWPGGRMITPTLAGTRPGGAISAAWAVMNYVGVEGYCKKHKLVTDARETIETGVKALGFEVLGNPQLGITAFSHPEVDVFAIYKQMYKKGWFTSLTTEPKALHLMLSPFHMEVTDVYLNDLESSLGIVKAGDTDAVTEARYS
jgi:glutamate/tyrosine decarboxylase-like PLP-dependent enzyme